MSSGGLTPRRTIVFQPQAIEDLRYWVEHDPRVAARVLELAKACRRDPFTGKGQPEPLRHIGPNIWSRRITQSARLVYRATDSYVDVLQARYHY